MRKECDTCGGRLDYPGLYGCEDQPHPKPTLLQRIVAAIEYDLTGRSRLRHAFEQIDADTQYEIREAWAEIIRKELLR